MTELNEIYRCGSWQRGRGSPCRSGQLVCCGQPMKKMVEHRRRQGEARARGGRTEDGILVKVGSVPHLSQSIT